MTGVDIQQLLARNTEGSILLVGEGFIVTAQLGRGLSVDTSTIPPTLNAIGGGVLDLKRRIYRLTGATADFTVPEAFTPTSLTVMCNGLMMSPGTETEGADYTINGSMVHFHPHSVPQTGWVVQLLYRSSK